MEKLNQGLFNDETIETSDSKILAGTCTGPAQTLTGCVGQLCADADRLCADLDF